MVEGVELASWGDIRRYDGKVAAHRDNGKTGEAFLPNLAFAQLPAHALSTFRVTKLAQLTFELHAQKQAFAVTLTFRVSALSYQLSHTLTPTFYAYGKLLLELYDRSHLSNVLSLLNSPQSRQLLYSQSVRACSNLLYSQYSPSPSPSSICAYIPPSSCNCTARQHTGN